MATPIGRVGPTPIGRVENATQLRAGTGSFWGDIKQDASNIFLPERFAADIAQSQNPGSTIEQDEDGRYILVRKDGSRHYLNEPGFGYQDVLNITGGLALGGGTALAFRTLFPKLAAQISARAMANPIKAGGVSGLGYGAAEQTVGASLTDQDFSTGEALNMGLMGTFLPILGRAGGGALNTAANLTGIDELRAPIRSALSHIKKIFTKDGELTKEAKDALEAAGVEWRYLTPEQIVKANNAATANTTLNPAAKGRVTALATEDITPSPGMTSQFPQTVLNESRGMDRGVREQAVRDLQELGDQIAPPERLASVGDRLVEQHNERLAQAAGLFAQARATGGAQAINRNVAEQLSNTMDTRLREVYDDETVDQVMAAFPKELRGDVPKDRRILDAAGRPIGPAPQGDMKRPINVRKIYEWRRNHLSKVEGRDSRRIFDEEMDRLFEGELIDDISKEGIDAWRKANADYRDYAVKWRSGDILEMAVVKDKQGYGLKHDPEEIGRLLLNASEVGFLSKPGLRQSIKALKETLGEDSPEFRDVGKALAHRALKLRSGFTEGQRSGSIEVNGVNMLNQWNRAKSEAGDVLEEVYPPEVIAKMDNFMEYARWMDTKIKSDVVMPDVRGMTEFAVRGLNRLADAHFRITRSAFRESATLTQDAGTQAAMREIYGDLFVPQGQNRFRVAGAIASDALWKEEFDEMLREMGYPIPGGRQQGLTIQILNGVTDR